MVMDLHASMLGVVVLSNAWSAHTNCSHFTECTLCVCGASVIFSAGWSYHWQGWKSY